ncbi:di-heme-cytochrome C peroxidase [Archangium lipolyticum]|uniref:di-heme-cytochrome C peroxidase n=1 Tax=Archangium lipolyticum TaxID=2970465 RepID=UPI00214A8403|nr:di-heme-cytochrome C peroxidase [Archangium lipolyticum]
MDGKKVRGVLVWLVLAGVMGSCASAPRAPPSPGPGTGTGGSGEGGLSRRERQEFYHLPQGNELLWLAVLRALPNRGTLEGRVNGFQSFLDEPERFGLLADPDNPEGLPVGMALVPASERQPAARVGVNCAACHVGEFHYRGARVRVDGAPGLLSMEDFNREAVEVMSRTLAERTRLLDFLQRLALHLPGQKRGGPVDAARLQAAYPDTDLTPDGDSSAQEKLVAQVEWYCGSQTPSPCAPPTLGPEPERVREFDEQLTQYVHELSQKQVRTVPDAIRLLRGHLLYFMRLGKLKFGTYAGPGRVDAFGVARGVLFGPRAAGVLVSPVSFPCLWEFQTQPWLHWDGNTNAMMERNIGQALGMGATVDPKTFASSVLPRNLAELERLSRKIESPRWPGDVFGRLDPARIERGGQLFARECQSCHGPTGSVVPLTEVRTDGNRARSFGAEVEGLPFPSALQDLLARVKQRAYAREGMKAEEIQPLDPGLIYWRAPEGYVARPLGGVWATPPYLHNGSVPTLWHLLQPASARPARFPVGQQEYDPERVGYVTEVSGTPRFVFDVSMPGNGNAGHEYGTSLSDEEKRDLLEYLKSL